jgi:hypothetical protein
MSGKQYQDTLMDPVVLATGILRGRKGVFSMHCLRRGGAQWRYIWCKRRWSFPVCKWWGGWDGKETKETMMKYLFNEEDAHSTKYADMLNPNRNHARSAYQDTEESQSISLDHFNYAIGNVPIIKCLLTTS